MKLTFRIFLAAILGFILAFGVAFLFLDLFQRPRPDQILLLIFSTIAFGYLTFSFSEKSAVFFQNWRKPSFDLYEAAPFIREHVAGILLALFFFLIYFYIGLKLNPAHEDTVDNYLDADNSSWMQRIADPEGGKLEMRGPHPFAYLIFRPLGFLLNIFTRDFSLSAILLNTLAGALCVFLAWFYFKKQTQSTTYSLIVASLLGASTSHFFFASVVETYIFSALFLIIFLVLLQKSDAPLVNLVVVGLITFGITLTNFVQSCITFFISRPRMKEVSRFVGLVISMGIVLSLIHNAWYPSSTLFFLPTGAQAEQEFTFSPFQEPSWRIIGRVLLLIRTVFLYTVVAPKPYVFTTEVGGTFPRFNFFKIAPETFSYSSYNGLGNLLIAVWILLLFSAGVLFVFELVRTRKVDLKTSLILCVLFNFLLHLYYGYEPFLYSPDWAYALIFFVGLSLAPFAKNKILQTGMLIFVLALIINQLQFFKFIFETIAPFIAAG